MTLKQWMDNGWLRPHKTSADEIENLFMIIDRDLKDAEGSISDDWRFGIAYNAALKLCTIILFVEGDIDVPYLTERESFRDVLLTGRLRKAIKNINLDDEGKPWLDDDRVNELVHLIERGHTDRFWRMVARVMPEYEEHARWLNENGADLDL